MKEHTIDAHRVHHEWDSSLEPTLVVESGDVVHFDLRMAGSGQVRQGDPIEQLSFDWTTLYHLLGPIAVDGALPGHAIQIDVLELSPGSWGWTAVLPDLGLLAEDFNDPFIRYFDIDAAAGVAFMPEIRLPVRPFLGTMGVHPGKPDIAPPFPPHRGGGNLDTKHLTEGTSLILPGFVEGGLFSCGDPHAAQGDGEVCVSAIECDMQATLRLHVRSEGISTPRFVTTRPAVPRDDSHGFYGTMGVDSDLMEGAKTAVRGMIELLGDEHELEREDAYVLCSLAGDLRIFEIVDAGVWNVGFTIPRSIFGV